MYQRVDKIEEENLDWNQPKVRLPKETPSIKKKDSNPPMIENKKSLNQSNDVEDLKLRVSRSIDKNMEITSFFGVILLPYFVGFLVVYILFFIYADMTIIGFFSIEKNYLLLQMWSIGAYLLVALWLLWTFSEILFNSKSRII